MATRLPTGSMILTWALASFIVTPYSLRVALDTDKKSTTDSLGTVGPGLRRLPPASMPAQRGASEC